MSDGIEALVAVVLIAVPLVICGYFLGLEGRATKKRFARFASELRARGFVIPENATHTSWNARGEIVGVPVAIEPQSVTTGTGKQARTDRFTAVRIEAQAGFSRWGIYLTENVPVTDLGAMREQTLPPQLASKYRAFAQVPEDAAAWLTREAQELLLTVGKVRSIETTSGALLLVLDGHPSGARLLYRAAELLAAMHARRAIPAIGPLPADKGWVSPWLTPALLPFGIATVAGVPVSCAPPILDAASPIACERGHIINRHTSKNPLRCVENGSFVEDAHLIPVLFGMSLIYYPAVLLLGLRARSRVKEEEPHDPQAIRPGGGAYR